jgi:cation transport ATPase
MQASLSAQPTSSSHLAHHGTSDETVDKQEQDRQAEYRSLMARFWFAAIISIPVVLTAYPQFVPGLHDLPASTIRLIWAVDALLTLPVLLWAGRGFFIGAINAFRCTGLRRPSCRGWPTLGGQPQVHAARRRIAR